jgi:hypothetical protein
MQDPKRFKNIDDVLDFLNDETDADIVIHVPSTRPSASDSSPQAAPSLPRLQACSSSALRVEHDEHAARMTLTVDEADVRFELALVRPVRPGAGRKDLATFEHNRRLITNDLISELYAANKDQREQMRQLVGLMMTMRDQPAGPKRSDRK